MMKDLPDIRNRKDIEKLVYAFYEEIRSDNLLGQFFKDTDWQKHLPVMVDFWENVLFYTGGYSGNPMEKHLVLDRKMHLTKIHFRRWLKLFSQAADSKFKGEKAELIKVKARNIATVMQTKIAD